MSNGTKSRLGKDGQGLCSKGQSAKAIRICSSCFRERTFLLDAVDEGMQVKTKKSLETSGKRCIRVVLFIYGSSCTNESNRAFWQLCVVLCDLPHQYEPGQVIHDPMRASKTHLGHHNGQLLKTAIWSNSHLCIAIAHLENNNRLLFLCCRVECFFPSLLITSGEK